MQYYKKRTVSLKNCFVLDGYTIVGPKENDGRYGHFFDFALQDDKFGQNTFERAERKMFEHAIDGVIGKCNLNNNDVDAVIGGDCSIRLPRHPLPHANSMPAFWDCTTHAPPLRNR